MSNFYHPNNANATTNALSIFSMGSTTHMEEGKKEFAKEGHRTCTLECLSFRLKGMQCACSEWAESYLAMEVKGKQDNDLILLQLKEENNEQKVMAFKMGEMAY